MKPVLVPAFVLLALVAGCGELDPLGRARLIAGTVLQGPDLEQPDGTPVEEGITVADVFYGETEAAFDVGIGIPEGIPGATVTLNIFGGLEDVLEDVPLLDQGNGTYAANSIESPELVYAYGAEYRVQVEDDQPEPFLVTVEEAPAAEPPRLSVDVHAAGTPLTVSRTGTDVAFVSVLRLDGASPQQTWGNLPDGPAELIAVVVDPTPYRAGTFEIPSEAFPAAGPYAVVLTTVERGVPSADLYADSGVWVGAAGATPLEVE